MAEQLVKRGFKDTVESPTKRLLIESLPLLYEKEDVVLYQDRDVLSFLNFRVDK